MSELYKICPICGTASGEKATVCVTCGTNLARVEVAKRQAVANDDAIDYDFRHGETDLLEKSVSKTANVYLVIIVTVLMTLGVVGIVLAMTTDIFAVGDNEPDIISPVDITPSPRPTIDAATVTMGPPTLTHTPTPQPTFTPSITPTRGPCTITLPQGQTLTWALGQCGHRSLDVVPTVLALNDLADQNSLRSGQEILIPWPTPTFDPNAVPTETITPEGGADLDVPDGIDVAAVDESIEAFQATALPTLPPGVMWHVVSAQENIITIADLYATDVQTLSQLNRQIDFARCDFGMRFGGADCIVQLFQGQQVRVPAPTPTPTLSPTPDPNATATPTPTATFNVPSAFSPTDREFFYNDELVTLRWVPTATLNGNEMYRIDVTDLTTDETFIGYTTDISFTVPTEWQGNTARHEYEWTVGIVSGDNTDAVRNATDPLIFVWQGVSDETESN
ncbi:MAG: hypothetical protein AAFV98_19855 [Chloroflexota bacterium]